MTDVTEDRDQAGAELSAADEQVLRELTERARTGGLKLTGEGGLLGRLTKMVIEGALEGELDDHLGYGKLERSEDYSARVKRSDLERPAMGRGPPGPFLWAGHPRRPYRFPAWRAGPAGGWVTREGGTRELP